MAGLVDAESIEAQIADCCHAIYWTTEPAVALSNWARLRRLTALKAETERLQFLRETAQDRPAGLPERKPPGITSPWGR